MYILKDFPLPKNLAIYQALTFNKPVLNMALPHINKKHRSCDMVMAENLIPWLHYYYYIIIILSSG